MMPSRVSEAGSPKVPAELSRHRLIGPPIDAKPQTWVFSNGVVERVPFIASFTVNNALMIKQAALAGMGIAMLPVSLVTDDLRAGTLVQLLTSYSVLNADVEVSLVYLSREFVPREIRTFVDFAVDYFR